MIEVVSSKVLASSIAVTIKYSGSSKKLNVSIPDEWLWHSMKEVVITKDKEERCRAMTHSMATLFSSCTSVDYVPLEHELRAIWEECTRARNSPQAAGEKQKAIRARKLSNKRKAVSAQMKKLKEKMKNLLAAGGNLDEYPDMLKKLIDEAIAESVHEA